MKRKSNNSFATLLSGLIIFLIVVLVVGFIYIRTDGLTSPLKNFYVSYGNDDIMSDRANFDVVIEKEYKFDITTNINITGKESKYKIAIVPNDIEKTNFTFSADETQVEYKTMESLAKGFSISAHEDYFTFMANLDLPEIIGLYYSDMTITGCPTAIDSDIPYFRLVISSVDNSETININFSLKSE